MANSKRKDGRRVDQLRKWDFVLDFQKHPLASVLAISGNTRVICSVSLE